MKILETPLSGLHILEPRLFEDSRGHFFESFNRSEFEAAGLPASFAQDNQSFSRRNVLRGLHYQLDQPQGKLVRVLSGAIFDVVVDLRKESPTLGQWMGFELSSENRKVLSIPEGFAHGFLVLAESAEVLYKVTTPYRPSSEHTIRWDDPELAIAWPLTKPPIVSTKDAAGSAWRDADLMLPSPSLFQIRG